MKFLVGLMCITLCLVIYQLLNTPCELSYIDICATFTVLYTMLILGFSLIEHRKLKQTSQDTPFPIKLIYQCCIQFILFYIWVPDFIHFASSCDKTLNLTIYCIVGINLCLNVIIIVQLVNPTILSTEPHTVKSKHAE